MNVAAIESVARALLYEGFLLYPYRRSSLKNQHRWMWGSLYPQQWAQRAGEPSSHRMECLVEEEGAGQVEIRVRFLQLRDHAESMETEVTERLVQVDRIALAQVLSEPIHREVTFEADAAAEREPPLRVGLDVRGVRVGERLVRLSVAVENQTPLEAGGDRASVGPLTLASTHLLLFVDGGEFVSLLETPEQHQNAAAACRQQGVWPVLIGSPGARNALLAAPIIVYDYPAVAKESPGDLFDATEIDEILSLRILTLSEGEKAELRLSGGRGRALLERTERLAPQELQGLHGAVRTPSAHGFRPGDRVRLRPKGRADVFDLALDGRSATVAKVEQDFEDRVFLAVTVDDDPGADLGRDGQIGHRFFYRPDEVELL